MTPVARIRRLLLAWYKHARRTLPWRETRDPYRVWVSEVMLQQTRVNAVLPYYERFIELFPDVESLAAAPERELLSAWAGLGYYSRARNMQKAAREIVRLGAFPNAYDAIRALPGVGDYTAAAIASISFGLPHAVVDGNVLRVLSRLFNDASDIGSTAGRKRFQALADGLLDRRCPAEFNQALMELGAIVCLPRAPQCLLCPLTTECAARGAGTQHQLPVKVRRVTTVEIEEILLVIRRNGQLALWRRDDESSRMAGFWELPHLSQAPRAIIGEPVGCFRHAITRYNYKFTVVTASVRRLPQGCEWWETAELKGLPLSTTTRKALRCLNV